MSDLDTWGNGESPLSYYQDDEGWRVECDDCGWLSKPLATEDQAMADMFAHICPDGAA